MSVHWAAATRRLRSSNYASLLLILVIAGTTGCAESGTEPPPYNRAPATVGDITVDAVTAASRAGTVGHRPSLAVDIVPYFADPDGDRLTFSATSSNTSVARVSAAGGTVSVSVAGTGTAVITVNATDPGGLTARQTFRIEVAGGLAAPRGPSQVAVAGGGSKRTYRTGETITTLPTGFWMPDAIDGATFVVVITSTSPPRGMLTVLFDHNGYIVKDDIRYTCISTEGCRIEMRTVGLGSIEATGGGSGAPDLVVESPSVSDASPAAGASFTLRATVRNQGRAQSASTTLRYYRSSNATISASDDEVGTDAVGGLAASGTSAESIALTAPTTAGTYHYGACVEPVSGESDRGNNCSSAVTVTVEGGGDDFKTLSGLTVKSDGGLTLQAGGITFSVGKTGCLIGGGTYNGKKWEYHQTWWQRDSGSGWQDVSGTKKTGRLCGYDLTNASAGKYRVVGDITAADVRDKYKSENTVTVGGGGGSAGFRDEFVSAASFRSDWTLVNATAAINNGILMLTNSSRIGFAHRSPSTPLTSWTMKATMGRNRTSDSFVGVSLHTDHSRYDEFWFEIGPRGDRNYTLWIYDRQDSTYKAFSSFTGNSEAIRDGANELTEIALSYKSGVFKALAGTTELFSVIPTGSLGTALTQVTRIDLNNDGTVGSTVFFDRVEIEGTASSGGAATVVRDALDVSGQFDGLKERRDIPAPAMPKELIGLRAGGRKQGSRGSF